MSALPSPWPFVLISSIGLSTAHATCPAPQTTVFSCLTKQQKRIEVCDAGPTLRYRFGPEKGPPELALSVPRARASTTPWSGMGHEIRYTVNIPNGNTQYRVFWQAQRHDNAPTAQAGVWVEVNGKTVATVQCSAQHPWVHNMEDIDLRHAD